MYLSVGTQCSWDHSFVVGRLIRTLYVKGSSLACSLLWTRLSIIRLHMAIPSKGNLVLVCRHTPLIRTIGWYVVELLYYCTSPLKMILPIVQASGAMLGFGHPLESPLSGCVSLLLWFLRPLARADWVRFFRLLRERVCSYEWRTESCVYRRFVS